MSSGALFPSLVSGSRGSSSKYLVEFRAGKMTMKGSTVTPDKRKGSVYVQQTDDSLIHFCWKDRGSGNVDDVSGLLDFDQVESDQAESDGVVSLAWSQFWFAKDGSNGVCKTARTDLIPGYDVSGSETVYKPKNI